MTQGWQNLTSERVRVRGRENILFEILKFHADAFETVVGDDLAYWIGSREKPELVGVAWDAGGGSWFYACMNAIAIDMGVQCTLLSVDGKNHIFPGSREQAEKQMAARQATPTAEYEEVGARRFLRAIFGENLTEPQRLVVEDPPRENGEVFREDGAWWKWVETPTMARQLGPYPTAGKAAKAQ